MNDEQIKEAKPAGASRLGKEAKIGVTAILVLVLIFGIVATMRFTRSAANDTVASAEDSLGDKEQLRRENKDDDKERYGEKKHHLGNNEKGIVVPVAPASTKRSEAGGRDANLWKFGSDKGEAKRGESGGPPIGSSPPLILDPPKAHDHEHADRERQEHEAAEASTGRYGERVEPLRGLGSEAHLLSPEAEGRSRSADAGVGRADPSGYAVAEAPPVPMHREKESARYGDVATQPQYSAGAGYGATGANGVNGYNNVAAEAGYRNHEAQHSARVSSLSSPPPRADGKYEVQPNDSYWTISERLYGTNAYFKALTAHNRDKGKGDEALRPGDLILAPAVAQLEQLYPELCPKPGHREAQQSQSRATTVSASHQQYRGGRSYTVAEGDTLFNIARYELGKASRWVEIYEMNRHVLGKDFNYLTPGIQLTLPEREKSETLTRQPGNAYR